MIFDRLRVFVSSSMAELAPERRAIQEALRELEIDAWLFEEDAGARSQTAEMTFHQELERADLFIGIFWNHLGKYTKDEFDHARAVDKSCLIYQKRNGTEGRRTPELQEFLDKVGHVTSGLTVKYFDTPDEFRKLVKQDVARWQAEEIRRRKTYRVRRPEALTEREEIRALSILRHKVRRFWIEGVLEDSVHDFALLELAKETRPDAVANPWTQVLELPDQTRRILPATQSMDTLLEEIGGSLLILGEPGSGKTISLLQLLRRLLDRADWNPSLAVPVVFNLSTWSGADTTLENWLVQELGTKYQIPRRIGRVWLREQRLLLLLDGLDEVADSQRAGCAKAIDQFAASVGIPGIVVCCRIREYTALPKRLRFDGAVCLRPLDRAQVIEHVDKAGPAFSGLAGALKCEANLLELATSPLMLDIMTIAFRNRPVGSRPDASLESWRDHIFEVYTERMFARAVGRQQYFEKGVVARSLHWLAREMQRCSQSIFLIEQLQPSALTSRWQRLGYVLTSRLAGGIILGFVLGLAIALGVGVGDESGGLTFAERFRDELALGLIAGSLFGLTLGVIDFVCLELRGDRARLSGAWSFLGLLPPGIAFCAGTWIALAVVDASDEDFIGPTMYVLGVGAACLIWGRRWLRQSLANDIRSVESLTWDWKRARIGGAIGFVAGLGVATLMLASMWPLGGSENAIIPQIIILDSLLFGLVGALFGGLRSGIVETRSKPNEGMRLSLRNAGACLVGGVAVISIGVVVIMALATAVALLLYPEALDDGGAPERMSLFLAFILVAGGMAVAAGLFVGVCACFWYGGVELIHHIVLRFVFRLTASMPLGLVRLLDQSASLILLRRAGGGYVFVHRLLLEYFARHGGAVVQSAPGRPMVIGTG